MCNNDHEKKVICLRLQHIYMEVNAKGLKGHTHVERTLRNHPPSHTWPVFGANTVICIPSSRAAGLLDVNTSMGAHSL